MKQSKVLASSRQINGSHYKYPLQPFEFALINNLSMIEGETIKYIARARRKNGAQDIDKAIHCLQMIAEWRSKFDQLCVPHTVLRGEEFILQFKLGMHEERAMWSFLYSIMGASHPDLSLHIAIRELKLAKHSYKNKKVIK